MRAFILTAALMLHMTCCPHALTAQCEDQTWTSNTALRDSAKHNQAIYDSTYRAGDFPHAATASIWLVKHASASGSKVYTQAIEVYDKLAFREKDNGRKKVYVDYLLQLYDLHAKRCAEQRQGIFNAKVLTFYKYNAAGDPAKTLHLFDSLLQLRNSEVTDETLIAYMETVKMNLKKYNKLTDTDIIMHYNRAMRIAEFKERSARRKGQPADKYLLLKDDIDALLFSMVVIDCNFVRKNLGPRFRQNPNDLTMARKIISFMLQNQCIDDPLWLEAGERIYLSNSEKDYSLSKSLGLRYFAIENYKKAEPFLQDAQVLAPTATDKAEILILLGRVKARTNKAEARKIFMQVLEIEKGNRQAYERIGDLYYNSADDCDDKKTNVKLVYLLAAEYYQRSGNDQKVSMARSKFPTREELVSAGYESGTQKFVGCWIQETATIRAKD